METLLFDKFGERPRAAFSPRPYQHLAIQNTFEAFDAGEPGVLCRMATGTGKTIVATLIIEQWLQRSQNHRALIISYERQLCHQFRAEVFDVLGTQPGLEMADMAVDADNLPLITVCSRATLQQHTLATKAQIDLLHDAGIATELIGLCTRALAKRCLAYLRSTNDLQGVIDELTNWQNSSYCDHEAKRVSRVHKFDHAFNWLLIWDEAHRHVMKLKSVGHIVEWFNHNPQSRRLGLTATPRRSDGTSLQQMFPAIAIDYPLRSRHKPSAVTDGWAVKYIQKYIKVLAVDFKKIAELCGTDQEKRDVMLAKQLEENLAAVCEPMLDLVGNRSTLIFSPSVAMAKDVAHYINARTKYKCDCGKIQWTAVPTECTECGKALTDSMWFPTPEQQAVAVYGEIDSEERETFYKGHQAGDFQFLSVCGLCREGYNDPNIGAVAVFRSVSEAAQSLAEQMKGRGSRPKRGVVDGLDEVDERLQAIAKSGKPDCLIIDLAGCTGLGDCATTVSIYAEGLDDEIVDRAQEIVVTCGEEDIDAAIDQAQREINQEREQLRKEREERERLAKEEAQRRAAAGVTVEYDVLEVGSGSNTVDGLTEKQHRYIKFLGMELYGFAPSKRQGNRIIAQLQSGMRPERVAYENHIKDTQWQPSFASDGQRKLLMYKGVAMDPNWSPKQASRMIELAKTRDALPVNELVRGLQESWSSREVDQFARHAGRYRQSYDAHDWAEIVSVGQKQRAAIASQEG